MKNIILSRTDSLGDVVLTLPLAGVLKNHFPGCRIHFLGKTYTKPLIESCGNVDSFLDWDAISRITDPRKKISILRDLDPDAIIHVFPVKEICSLARSAGIPLRVSTSHRWFSWLYCNKLVHFSRKKSDLHEVQLNLKLLEPLGFVKQVPLSGIPRLYGLSRIQSDLPESISKRILPDRFNLILHPGSKGSAREWGTENFSSLIKILPGGKFRIFITGTREEGASMKEFLRENEGKIIDLTGKLSLTELIAFISRCDGIVAASTGPLHIAAALGKRAIGLYAPMRPIFPKRWAPLGKNAEYLVLDKTCEKCRHSGDCECIRSISPADVAGKLIS
jgi:heptosyltransferase III